MSRLLTDPTPQEQILKNISDDYLAQYNNSSEIAPEDVVREMLGIIRDQFLIINAAQDKSLRWPIPSTLPNALVAKILIKLHKAVRLALGTEAEDSDSDVVGFYMSDGPNEGIYSTDLGDFKRLCRKYKVLASKKDLDEIYDYLHSEAPHKSPVNDPDLVAVNNGILNYKTKELMPFTDELVFLTKSPIDFKPNAENPIIIDPDTQQEWDVETWVQSLTDDPQIADLLWKSAGAAIRPNVSWNKAVFLVSPQGNNGKGTFCQLIRNICGAGSCISLQLSDMGKDFVGEPLLRASAIITDENDVSAYVDKAALFKSFVTHDVFPITRKYKSTIPYRCRGFMLQCLNDFPRFKDKSESLKRRLLIVPMDKCFTGAENKKIKSEYIRRKDVLEYVLKKVLTMDYYEIEEPESCKRKKFEFDESNNAVLEFAVEIVPRLAWQLVPTQFLFDLYTVWLYRNNPGGTKPKRNTFLREMRIILENHPEWDWTYNPENGSIRTKHLMDKPEPLIEEYGLVQWSDDSKRQDRYRGFERISASGAYEAMDDPRPVLPNQIDNLLAEDAERRKQKEQDSF